MTPNSPETRIGELEQKVARLDQRVQDLVNEVNFKLAHLQDDLRETNVLVSHVRQSIKDRDARQDIERREQLADSRNWRRALILGSFTVLAAIIAAAATIAANTP